MRSLSLRSFHSPLQRDGERYHLAMLPTIKSYEIDAVGNTEMLFACTALLSAAALAGGTTAAQPQSQAL
jgi:hypothetical protein